MDKGCIAPIATETGRNWKHQIHRQNRAAIFVKRNWNVWDNRGIICYIEQDAAVVMKMMNKRRRTEEIFRARADMEIHIQQITRARGNTCTRLTLAEMSARQATRILTLNTHTHSNRMTKYQAISYQIPSRSRLWRRASYRTAARPTTGNIDKFARKTHHLIRNNMCVEWRWRWRRRRWRQCWSLND